jgi:hypothetical protein
VGVGLEDVMEDVSLSDVAAALDLDDEVLRVSLVLLSCPVVAEGMSTEGVLDFDGVAVISTKGMAAGISESAIIVDVEVTQKVPGGEEVKVAGFTVIVIGSCRTRFRKRRSQLWVWIGGRWWLNCSWTDGVGSIHF